VADVSCVASLLFTGLLINRETVVPAFQWLHTVSFFHAAFEALAVNELRYLQLKEIKVRQSPCLPLQSLTVIISMGSNSTSLQQLYCQSLDCEHRCVPHPTVRCTGLIAVQSFWWPNISLLGIFFVVFTAASYITLHFFVREKR
jgi:hypothetical protein